MDKYNYLMNALVSEFKLTSSQQSRFGKLLRDLENESFENGKDFAKRSMPEPRKQFKAGKNDIADKEYHQRQDELNWAENAQRANDWLEQQRNS